MEAGDLISDKKSENFELSEFDFMNYAAVNWTSHSQNAQTGEGALLFQSALALYNTSSRHFRIWFSEFWFDLERFEEQPKGILNLHIAAITGHTAIVRNLLMARHDADLNAIDSGVRTPLHWAADYGHEAVVRLLLARGASIDIGDDAGRTALHCAAIQGHEAVVRLLLERGASVDIGDKRGQTALHNAANRGREAVARLLVERGADINVKDVPGNTALDTAYAMGQETMVQLLEQHSKAS